MSGSVVAIKKNGSAITGNVILESATFDSQLNALPGTFSFTCKDPTQTLSFVTGDEITLEVDGTKLFGGYLTQISRTYAFPADDTTPVSAFENRFWQLRGSDYNVLFDKLVVRDTSNYLSQIQYTNTSMDGTLLSNLLTSHIDLPAGFDVTTEMDDVAYVNGGSGPSSDTGYYQQGITIRKAFETFALMSGAIWYVDADKKFHWHAIEDQEKRWGFSDVPNNNAITTNPASYQGATYGFREMEAVEDGSFLVNDALIWGGSQWSPDTKFARIQDSASQSDHGRWQKGELHFNEENFGTQSSVDARGDVIVYGNPTGTDGGPNRGLKYPQWNINLSWFAKDVPLLSGTPNHIRPGDLVTIDLDVFSLVKELPCRSIKVSFPTGEADGTSHVRFDGSFGLQLDDPIALWNYLLRGERDQVNASLATVSGGSTSTIYGAYGAFQPTPAPDGAETIFDIPFGYIPETLEVYLNGLIQRRNTDYTETAPDTGGFTMSSAPFSDDTLWVTCRTLNS